MPPILINATPERTVIDFRPLGFHDVIVLGRYKYSSAHPELDPHSHRQMIEICFLEKGRQIYVVEGQEYALESGDIFVTYPGERHGTGGHPECKGTLYWLILSVPKPRERFLSLAPTDWHHLLGPLLSKRPRKCRGTPHLKTTLDRIIAVYQDDSDPLRKVNLQNQMLRFLLDVIACTASPGDRSPSKALLQVLKSIDEQIEREDIPLKALASLAGLSLSRFKARFRTEIGIPPAEYIARRKVEKATEWLLDGNLPVTEIAMRLGFSTSQYFSTVYKRFTGKSPSQVRTSRK